MMAFAIVGGLVTSAVIVIGLGTIVSWAKQPPVQTKKDNGQ